MVNFDDLARREPGLAALLAEARAVSSRGNPQFCANAVWFGFGKYRYAGLKPRLVQLVGWHAHKDDPVLRSQEAYEVAYDTIYGALPDCRDCGEMEATP